MKTVGSVMLGIGAVDRNSGYSSELDYGKSDGTWGNQGSRRLMGLGHTMSTPTNIHTREVNWVAPVAPATPDQGALADAIVPPQGSCTFDESQTHDATYGSMKLQGDRFGLGGLQDYGLGGAGSRRSGCLGLPLGVACTGGCMN